MHKVIVILITLFLTPSLLAKTVLVVGGAGYIGSHINKKLAQSGYKTVVLDNLSSGDLRNVKHGIFVKGDISDTPLLDHIFTTHSIDAVMHFAAFSEVGDSVLHPLKYYKNNVSGTINLLEAMQLHDIKLFIFSSSASIFGIPNTPLIDEDHLCHPLNPYGESKLMVEKILQDLNHLCGLRYCSLRYFNAAGGDPEGILKNYRTKNLSLIPIVLESLLDPHGSITIFGTDYPTPDGTCIRDYIHVEDLAAAHIAAMESLFNGAPSATFNLGSGKGYSIKEVIAAVETVTGLHVNVIEGARRKGDPSSAIANSEKAQRELHWTPEYSSLETMIKHTWLAMHNSVPQRQSFNEYFADVDESQRQSDQWSLYSRNRDEDNDNRYRQRSQSH